MLIRYAPRERCGTARALSSGRLDLVSYDLTIYFDADAFPHQAYEAFVANSVRTLGNWREETDRRFDFNRDRELHDYFIANLPDEDLVDDAEKYVRVSVMLCRNNPEWCDPPFRRFRYHITVESGASRSPLALAIQLLVVASSFRFLPDAVVVDGHTDDAENAVTYTRREEFLRHAARVVRRLCGRDRLEHPERLDGFWAEVGPASGV